MDALSFCRQDVTPPHSELATALQGVSPEHESSLLGILAFHLRVCEIPHRASERQLAQTQLQWWRTQLTTEAHSTHPSLQALAPLRARIPTLTHLLAGLLDTVEADIDFAGFAEQQELDTFLQQRGELLLQLLCYALNLSLTSDAAKAIGGFLEYCQLVHELPRHASAHVVYLPYSLLSQHGVTAEQVCQQRDTPLRAVLTAESAHQRALLRAGLRTLTASQAQQLEPILIWLALRYRWLAATETDGYALQHYRLQLGGWQRWQVRLFTKLKLAAGRFTL